MSVFRLVNPLLLGLFLSACGGGAEDASKRPNEAPTIKQITVKTEDGSAAILGKTLIGEYTYSDPEKDPEGKSLYQWIRNGNEIVDATALSYQIQEADKDAALILRVTPIASRGTSAGNAAESRPLVVGNDAPKATDIQIRSSGAQTLSGRVGETLQASYRYTDLEGDNEDTSLTQYQWYRDGEPITNANSQFYTLKKDDLGKEITVEIRVYALEGSIEGATTMNETVLTVVNSAPQAKNLVLSSNTSSLDDVVVGSKLFANYQYSDVDGDAESGTIVQWIRNDVPVSTGMEYTVKAADSGKSIHFHVAPRASSGVEFGETSQSTNVNINNSPPFVVNNSIALVSDGGNLSSVHVGDTLSVEFEFGDPDNDAQGSHLYQWYRGTNAIPAEYKISYQVKTSDNTLNLSVKITPAQLDGTQGETKTSPVVNVINRAPTIIGKPLIANTSSNDLNQTHVGDILTASYQFNDPDGDAEGASTGVWTRDGSEIPLSNEKSYTLKAADSGKNIAYLVKELRDIHGLSTQTAGVSVSVLVQNTAPHINSIVLAGSAELNTELTALVSFSDVDGDGAGSHLYQWKRNGANVGGKSLSNTYLVGALDVGTKISVEVTPQDDKGLYGEPVLSTAAAIFDFSNPAMFNLSITPNIKQLNISWDKIAIADYYRVLFKTDAGSGYSVAADELGTEKFSLNIATHKMDWTNASIIIEACGSNSCLSSNETMLNSLMISSIGYFKAFNSEEGDTFGWAVALSNDGKTMAVGAQFEDSAAKGINNTNPGWNDNSLLDSGAVYIYQRYVDTWLPQAYIKASNPGKDDKFGERLALSGDGNTLVVGAPLEDSNERGITAGSPEYGDFEANPDYNAGAVYVYRRTGNSWSQQAYLKGSNTDSLDFFGDAVSISYDGNTIAVGTFSEDSKFFGVDNLNTHPDQEDNSLDYSGAAYVFQFNNGAWAQQAYIKSSHPVNNDYFGRHLDISDDGNTLVVGATGEDTKSTGVISGESPELPSEIAGGSGAVFIFERDLGLWRQVAFVKASNTGGGDEFGSSVAISGDAKTLVVGAKGEDGGYKGVINGSEPQIPPDNLGVIFKTGAAYVYRKVADTWIHDAYLKASNTGKIDIYGYTVAISGDGNTVAVQGRQEDGNFHGVLWGDADPLVDGNQGAVYVYKRDSEWKQLSYVKAINVSPITFGDGLALDQDGSTMAVGSPGDRSAAKEINSTNPGPDDISAYSSGAVFLY